MSDKNEIVLYQPDNSIRLDVRVEHDTVWLTQAQMVELFGRDRTVVTKHINNIFKEGELDEKSNVQFLHFANSDKPIKIYSLDVIISVGYRVKSYLGTQFRIWANKILKDYLLKGYAINQRFEQLEQHIGQIEHRTTETENAIAFFVQKSLPPIEGIYHDGQVFDAYAFVANLIKSAQKSIILLDNYIDESVLLLLSKRADCVTATIYTKEISKQLQLDLQRHQTQYPAISVEILTQAHDRFLMIDGEVYHIGASLKDLGKKLFAVTKMEFKAADILAAAGV
ncbi:DNA-binding protein [Bacteroidia bacterium]|nr:DNA-binding protein [Bacteroidia bacterium]